MNLVPGRTEVLHSPESGICADKINGNVMSYAGQLARYIKCPSTIRARVLEQFDCAPTIDDIRALQDRKRLERDKFRVAHDGLGGEPEDRHNFRVRSLLPRRAAIGVHRKSRAHAPEPDWTQDAAPPPAVIPAIPGEIIAAIAAEFGLKQVALTGPSRIRRLIPARQTAAYVLRQRGNTYEAAGRWLGGRDHSTALHLCRGFEATATPEMREIAGRYIGGGQP